MTSKEQWISNCLMVTKFGIMSPYILDAFKKCDVELNYESLRFDFQGTRNF